MTVSRLAQLPFRIVRRLRWRAGGWSKDSDRRYHERLYTIQHHDPFRPDYPGYVTIRRFADHVEDLLPTTGSVLDVGCGPGEITCELARRHPHLSFTGIDHSEQAVARAAENARRLGLRNTQFIAGDAERLALSETYGLVTMFDAFHHLEQPEVFLRWLRAKTSRCVLIEPAGTATGRWSRDLDLDWLLADLANIRERLEAFCREEPVPTLHATPAAEDAPLVRGQGAVERRYALADFERFFEGWQLRVRGTVAGFDAYPPGANLRGPMRAAMGEVAYSLVRTTEEALLRQDQDGAAKHWVIAATSEREVIEPRLPSVTKSLIDVPPTAVASAYAVRYLRSDGPVTVRGGERFAVTLSFLNEGWAEWSSSGPTPIKVSYHWLTKQGQMHTFDGLRTLLPHAVGPGESCEMTVTIESPETPGSYLLGIDMVKEGVTWFSETGAPCSTTAITVTTPGK